ncbi:MAG: bifunctional folylpolyglutamate synthase/dihydrofolate synthase [Gammaproteobacteria bacterium]|nr:bifunctional folylpolyglutamate synthase/dihydrofolate synthase [Gammaproteobacteria bacterium]
MSNNKTIEQWLSYFEMLHPVGIDMGLDRVSAVWRSLCETYEINKVAKDKVFIVSGTNGKGSTCHMLSLLLQSNAKRVGMYTSPHIHEFNERVRINFDVMSDEQICEAFAAIDAAREDISLSYFEATTLVGLLIFAWQEVDFAVLEVGLGGRMDAVNVIDADVAIVTSVGIDHEAFLGHDVSKIALEKAGVFRSGKPAVYAQPNIFESVVSYANDHDVLLLANGEAYEHSRREVVYQDNIYELPQILEQFGNHQLQNGAAVIVSLVASKCLPHDYKERLKLFSVPGRLQVIGESPKVVVDVAHNEDAAQTLVQFINKQKHTGKVYGLIGMLADKNHYKVLSLVSSSFDEIYFGTTYGERGCDGLVLQQVLCEVDDVSSFACSSIKEAFAEIKSVAKSDDVIYAFGSFLVAEALLENSDFSY